MSDRRIYQEIAEIELDPAQERRTYQVVAEIEMLTSNYNLISQILSEVEISIAQQALSYGPLVQII